MASRKPSSDRDNRLKAITRQKDEDGMVQVIFVIPEKEWEILSNGQTIWDPMDLIGLVFDAAVDAVAGAVADTKSKPAAKEGVAA